MDPFIKTYQEEITITESSFAGNIHDSIPESIYKHLESEKHFREMFNIYSPSRVILEGENTASWNNTEDWAITGSYKGGELVIGQSVSCRGKEDVMCSGLPKDYFQLRSFENRISWYSKVYDKISGIYSVTVDKDPESVKALEKRVEKDIEDKGLSEIDVVIYELEKDRETDWSRSLSHL